MKKISEITGREYAPFTYYGAADAERIIVAMGSVTKLQKKLMHDCCRRKVGMIKGSLVSSILCKIFNSCIAGNS